MPIDPTIALQVKAPEPLDLLGLAGKAESLRGLFQGRQMHEQQMEQNALKLQQQEQEMADRQALMGLYRESEGDLDKVILKAAGKISPLVLDPLIKFRDERNTAERTKRKDELELERLEAETIAEWGEKLRALKDPVERSTLWKSSAYPTLSRVLSKPKAAQLPQEVPDDELLGLYTMVSKAEAARLRRLAAQQQADSRIARRAARVGGEVALSLRRQADVIRRTMVGAKTQGQWASRRSFLAGKGPDGKPRLSPEALALIPETYSTEAVQQVSGLGAEPGPAEGAAAGPPISAFTDGKLVHRFKSPSGQIERWQLINGVPTKVE